MMSIQVLGIFLALFPGKSVHFETDPLQFPSCVEVPMKDSKSLPPSDTEAFQRVLDEEGRFASRRLALEYARFLGRPDMFEHMQSDRRIPIDFIDDSFSRLNAGTIKGIPDPHYVRSGLEELFKVDAEMPASVALMLKKEAAREKRNAQARARRRTAKDAKSS